MACPRQLSFYAQSEAVRQSNGLISFCLPHPSRPISQRPDGRDHNRHAFSLWLAGGGFKQGCVYGATDPFGYASVEDVVNVQDLHTTLLASLGLDHMRLTAPYDGRETSLTDAEVTRARVVTELLR